MKKIALSMVAIATVSMAGGEIAPMEPVVETAHTTPAVESSFLDRFHFKGDLRLRYESIERDDADNKYRNRYRLRLGSKIDLTDSLQFQVGMRSGFANPTSGNQTFNDDEPLSDYFLQSLRFNILGLAYKTENGTLKVGRQPYMMYRPIKSQLVWDNDVSMNGVNYQYKDDSSIITLGVNQPTLEEASVAKDDVNLFLAQYVHKTKLDAAKLNVGAGIYYYDGLKGNTTLFGSRKGNTLDTNGLYANDYHLVEGFAELQLKDVFGKPLKVAAGVVYNFGADENNFGYDLGIQLGKAKKVGDWQVKYSYTELEEDASFGAYSDSDNFGGGTSASGHAIRAKYKAGKNLYLAGNFFFNEIYASNTKTGEEADYERVQLDMIYKF
ncbi:MAG: Outer membrane receptor for ferric coprogen and ferric-rhodotorulic acid [uncultured Sulfurovum sp.]|uniref:Outer membrane receptor for ferric coprogen and ferric-rhodotorulic acid n=1 Tax=uncultured Sulfurovum sp. TaxID=269237 RepID=A0A6S6TDQ2_9BACT|nr:MAG: Outer membrane receptor for ferric coprogen and ferric-rhodotorulic acid [uncultured Sulfurovum sp.]